MEDVNRSGARVILAKKYCPSCAYWNPETANFCENCGTKLPVNVIVTMQPQAGGKKPKKLTKRREHMVKIDEYIHSPQFEEGSSARALYQHFGVSFGVSFNTFFGYLRDLHVLDKIYAPGIEGHIGVPNVMIYSSKQKTPGMVLRERIIAGEHVDEDTGWEFGIDLKKYYNLLIKQPNLTDAKKRELLKRCERRL